MAASPEKNREIERLIRLSAASRAMLGTEVTSIREKLAYGKRMKESIIRHPSGWFGGSLLAGLGLGMIMPGKSKPKEAPKKRKGLLGITAGLAFAAAKPALRIYLASQLKRIIAEKTGFAPTNRTIPSDSRFTRPR